MVTLGVKFIKSVKVKVDAKRSRSSISVYPALEVLQRGAYNNYMERLAHANRNFLNCVGKRGQTTLNIVIKH